MRLGCFIVLATGRILAAILACRFGMGGDSEMIPNGV
jgi:hypothetical protein